MNRNIICVVGVLTLLLTPFAVIAADETETDDTGDVWHWKWNDNSGTFSWQESTTSRSNIDITELTYTVDNQQITFQLKVHGSIQDAENIGYLAYYNTTDANYWMTYNNGQGGCYGTSTTGTNFSFGNATVAGNTLTATVDAVGTGSKEAFYGFAAEYTEYGNTNAEWWGDWAPQGRSPWHGINNGGGGNDDNGTPGFELVLLLSAACIAIMMLRRKR
jgi:hypothetical protein